MLGSVLHKINLVIDARKIHKGVPIYAQNKNKRSHKICKIDGIQKEEIF